jgi:hypothetical protein
LTGFRRFSPGLIFAALLTSVWSLFRCRGALQLEILGPPHHQLGVLMRSVKRLKLTLSDRLLWAALLTVWQDQRSASVIVNPETVIA